MFHKKLLLSVCFFGFFAGQSFAQATDPAVGIWKTIDDKTNEPSSLIKIEDVNGVLEGTVIKIIPTPGKVSTSTCSLCKDERKDKPIVGMKIMTDLKREKPGVWTNGKILDPEEGEIYRVRLVTEDGKKMDVRGYIGIPLLGRTQVWYKAEQ